MREEKGRKGERAGESRGEGKRGKRGEKERLYLLSLWLLLLLHVALKQREKLLSFEILA